jgi:hypothetical protein
MYISNISSFGPLDRYLETQDSLLYAATRPNNQSQEAFWDEGAAGAGGAKKKETGLKRKTSEKGSRAQEVSFVSSAGDRLRASLAEKKGTKYGNSFCFIYRTVLEEGEHFEDAKTDFVLSEED